MSMLSRHPCIQAFGLYERQPDVWVTTGTGEHWIGLAAARATAP